MKISLFLFEDKPLMILSSNYEMSIEIFENIWEIFEWIFGDESHRLHYPIFTHKAIHLKKVQHNNNERYSIYFFINLINCMIANQTINSQMDFKEGNLVQNNSFYLKKLFTLEVDLQHSLGSEPPNDRVITHGKLSLAITGCLTLHH